MEPPDASAEVSTTLPADIDQIQEVESLEEEFKAVKSVEEFLPLFKTDLKNRIEALPNVKIESLRTLSRMFQSLLYSWTPDHEGANLKEAAQLYVNLLLSFRSSQRTGKQTMTDDEITDCGFPDIVRVSEIALRDFMNSPRSFKERKNMWPVSTQLKQLWLAEGQLNSQRAKVLKFRKGTASGVKIGPNDDTALSQQLESVVAPLLPKPEEQKQKLLVVEQIANTIRSFAPNARCEVFGSSASGLGFAASDVDIALHPEDFTTETVEEMRKGVRPESLQADLGFREREGGIESPDEWASALKPEAIIVLRAAQVIRDSGLFDQVETVCTARVPVVKMVHKNTQLQCDVAVGNLLAVHNTALLRTYSGLNANAKMMIMCVKLWAKRRGIGDASCGFLSSYAWTLLALFYLQRCPKELGGVALPNLQLCMPKEGSQLVDETIEGFKVRYVAGEPDDAARALMVNCNSAGSLLRGFFAFYSGKFNYVNDCVLFDNSKNPRKNNDVMRWRFSIIDPFELTHDLGTTLSGRRAQTIINEEIWRAFNLVSNPIVSNMPAEKASQAVQELFAESVMQATRELGRPCMFCGETGHRAKQCTTFSSNAADSQRCFSCGSKSHLSKECPTRQDREVEKKRLKDQRDAKMVCFKCGGKGHAAKQCPNVATEATVVESNGKAGEGDAIGANSAPVKRERISPKAADGKGAAPVKPVKEKPVKGKANMAEAAAAAASKSSVTENPAASTAEGEKKALPKKPGEKPKKGEKKAEAPQAASKATTTTAADSLSTGKPAPPKQKSPSSKAGARFLALEVAEAAISLVGDSNEDTKEKKREDQVRKEGETQKDPAADVKKSEVGKPEKKKPVKTKAAAKVEESPVEGQVDAAKKEEAAAARKPPPSKKDLSDRKNVGPAAGESKASVSVSTTSESKAKELKPKKEPKHAQKSAVASSAPATADDHQNQAGQEAVADGQQPKKKHEPKQQPPRKQPPQVGGEGTKPSENAKAEEAKNEGVPTASKTDAGAATKPARKEKVLHKAKPEKGVVASEVNKDHQVPEQQKAGGLVEGKSMQKPSKFNKQVPALKSSSNVEFANGEHAANASSKASPPRALATSHAKKGGPNEHLPPNNEMDGKQFPTGKDRKFEANAKAAESGSKPSSFKGKGVKPTATELATSTVKDEKSSKEGGSGVERTPSKQKPFSKHHQQQEQVNEGHPHHPPHGGGRDRPARSNSGSKRGGEETTTSADVVGGGKETEHKPSKFQQIQQMAHQARLERAQQFQQRRSELGENVEGGEDRGGGERRGRSGTNEDTFRSGGGYGAGRHGRSSFERDFNSRGRGGHFGAHGGARSAATFHQTSTFEDQSNKFVPGMVSVQQKQMPPREEDFPVLNPAKAKVVTTPSEPPMGFSYAAAAVVGMFAPPAHHQSSPSLTPAVASMSNNKPAGQSTPKLEPAEPPSSASKDSTSSKLQSVTSPSIGPFRMETSPSLFPQQPPQQQPFKQQQQHIGGGNEHVKLQQQSFPSATTSIPMPHHQLPPRQHIPPQGVPISVDAMFQAARQEEQQQRSKRLMESMFGTSSESLMEGHHQQQQQQQRQQTKPQQPTGVVVSPPVMIGRNRLGPTIHDGDHAVVPAPRSAIAEPAGNVTSPPQHPSNSNTVPSTPPKKANWAELEEQEEQVQAAKAAKAAAQLQQQQQQQAHHDRMYRAGNQVYSFQELQKKSLEQRRTLGDASSSNSAAPPPPFHQPPPAAVSQPLPKPVLSWPEPANSGPAPVPSIPPFTLPPLPGRDASLSSVPLPPRFSLPPPGKF